MFVSPVSLENVLISSSYDDDGKPHGKTGYSACKPVPALKFPRNFSEIYFSHRGLISKGISRKMRQGYGVAQERLTL